MTRLDWICLLVLTILLAQLLYVLVVIVDTYSNIK